VGPRQVDALIITALMDELEAVLAFGGRGKDAWTAHKDLDGFPFHYRELPREDGGSPLRLAAASFDEMGGIATATRATSLIKHLGPACLAMCGICAGNRKDVFLGDVIVADRVYSYDDGKRIAGHDEDGQPFEKFLHNLKTYNLQDTWRVDAASFARELGWAAEFVKSRPLSWKTQQEWFLRTLLEHEQNGTESPPRHADRDTCCPDLPIIWDQLRRDSSLLEKVTGAPKLSEEGRAHTLELVLKYPKALPKDPDFRIHVGPIATGMAVQQDPELFERLKKISRKTLGAEMEASAIGLVSAQLGRQALIVKGVSDYGDADKDDRYRAFAARASAEVLIRFLLRRPELLEHQEIEDVQEPDSREPSHFLRSREDGPRGDTLLSRVEILARLRARDPEATVEIRRRPAPPPFGGYLEVSQIREKSFSSIYPVAAVDQVDSEVFDAFLRDIDARYRRADPGVRSALIYGDSAHPPPEVKTQADAKRIVLQSFTEYQGLIDFRAYLSGQQARLEKDPIYPHALYVAQRAVLPTDSGETETEDVLAEFVKLLDSRLGRFILVLGDFGTGKTFLLRELARKIGLERNAMVPVLVEMRALEKASTLDALIAQHFALAGMEQIDLKAFKHMLSEGRIVLLFDGFDELALRISYERAAEHFATLIDAARERPRSSSPAARSTSYRISRRSSRWRIRPAV
jgi:nucleoside phosphorylase